MKARIKFRKYGVMKFIGHLDVMRYFQKVMRRAEIPIAFTGGYSPHMIMSFAQPLGVGITSDGEYLDIELCGYVSREDAIERMNRVMVEGIEVTDFTEISEDRKASGMTITAAAAYKVFLLASGEDSEARIHIPLKWRESYPHFLGQTEALVWKKTKKSEKEVDILPMIYDMKAEEEYIFLFLAAGSEQNLKPDLVMHAFLTYMGVDTSDKLPPLHYHRMELYAKGEGPKSFIPLSDMGYNSNKIS